ncbi:Hypothetical protein R9X50_00773200 [Acrodontium crateriforme]|uniref:Uncharacterized protein n=1 Tax=Acrodontium crateriforme TaxID=150365 RepID=A0AAQ3MBT2_9PEZI|nr:Hypothetical protein R9X50_00773200 [Acrodontium crateriforme]
MTDPHTDSILCKPLPARSSIRLPSDMEDIPLDGTPPAKPVPSSPFLVARKTLPWLDGGFKQKAPPPSKTQEEVEAIPFDGRQKYCCTEGRDPLPILSNAQIPAYTEFPGGNPSVREVGSAPSLRDRSKTARAGDIRTLSLSSKLRPGTKLATSKQHAEMVLGVFREGGPRPTDYSPSEYSVEPSHNDAVGASPARGAASYEKVLHRPLHNRTSKAANSWLQSQIDLPFGKPPAEAVTRLPKSYSCRSSDEYDQVHKRINAIEQAAAQSESSQSMHIQSRRANLYSPGLSPRALIQRPAPATKRFDYENRRLDHIFNDLENLMEQALSAAKDAAQNGRSQEVAQILDSATLVLKKTSKVHGEMEQSTQNLLEKLEASSDSEADYSVSAFSTPPLSRSPSIETVPTLLTKIVQSSRPVLIPQPNPPNRRSLSETAATNGINLSGDESLTKTPPRLYHPPSADSIVRDFAYARNNYERVKSLPFMKRGLGAAADYYGDMGQSVETQPGVRQSIIPQPTLEKALPELPQMARDHHKPGWRSTKQVPNSQSRALQPTSTTQPAVDLIPPKVAQMNQQQYRFDTDVSRRRKRGHPHVSDFFEPAFFHHQQSDERRISTVTDSRYDHIFQHSDKILHDDDSKHAMRLAGEVPKIQYQIADVSHKVILGNVLLFVGLGLTTMIFWPLPLLHGRKPYTLMAFALMLPLQFPQALAVSAFRDPNNPLYRCGLLIPRILTGLAMGFANINQLPTLFDLFGVSLMSAVPHQEIVTYDDVRRQGGGVGMWLGIWSWCFIGSLSIGFCIGACIISSLDPSWGFHIVVILLALFLLVNVIAPETRRAPYRRSIAHFLDNDEKLQRRVARGEVKLHVYNDGPKWWFEEVWAGMVLTKRMLFQPGCFVLMVYLAWIYCQATAIVLLLGALLSRDYQWQPQYVGGAVSSLAIGAFLAVPLDKASLFSRSRFTPQRTDSMTMQTHRIRWSSHMIRRCIFTFALPLAGLAYTLSSPGNSVHWFAPIIFCALVGFLSNLAIAECVGLIMETFDTCDLQPGVNTKHRLQSMGDNTRRRRTNYSSFPRVCAAFFCAQGLGFFLAAAATGVSGDVTRALGAQTTTAIVASILLVITIFLMLVLWRFRQVQVIPTTLTNGFPSNDLTKRGDKISGGPGADDPEWTPVVIGNPSGKMRRVNLLETGSLSRWTEIRKLNKLVKR